MEMNHSNHAVSKDNFDLYPEQRKIVLDETSLTILGSKSMNMTEKRELLEKRSGSLLLDQDIRNVSRSLENNDSDKDKCSAILEENRTKGGFSNIKKDQEGNFVCLSIATSEMLEVLALYPHCLLLDVTYKVNQYLLPLLTIMVIDKEGHGMPVFHAFLGREDTETISMALESFSALINAEDLHCVIVDKSMAEIGSITRVFPGVTVNLCQFHISQAIQRELRKQLPSGSPLIQSVHDTFMAQVTTESEAEFLELGLNLKAAVPPSLVAYFEKNWWSKSWLWASCYNVNVLKLNATTTNWLESYHGKIKGKDKLSSQLSLAESLLRLLNFNVSKITNAARKQKIEENTVRRSARDEDETDVSITKCLPRWSAEFVKKEWKLSKSVDYVSTPLSNGQWSISYKEKSHVVTLSQCDCSFYGNMRLPCRHMFFVRASLSLSPFDVELVHERFRLKDVPLRSGNLIIQEALHVEEVMTSCPSLKTSDGRFKVAKKVCDDIASHLAICGLREFKEKFQELKNLRDSWSSDKSIQKVNDGVAGFSDEMIYAAEEMVLESEVCVSSGVQRNAKESEIRLLSDGCDKCGSDTDVVQTVTVPEASSTVVHDTSFVLLDEHDYCLPHDDSVVSFQKLEKVPQSKDEKLVDVDDRSSVSRLFDINMSGEHSYCGTYDDSVVVEPNLLENFETSGLSVNISGEGSGECGSEADILEIVCDVPEASSTVVHDTSFVLLDEYDYCLPHDDSVVSFPKLEELLQSKVKKLAVEDGSSEHSHCITNGSAVVQQNVLGSFEGSGNNETSLSVNVSDQTEISSDIVNTFRAAGKVLQSDSPGANVYPSEQRPDFNFPNLHKIGVRGRPSKKQSFTKKSYKKLPVAFCKLSENKKKKLILEAVVSGYTDQRSQVQPEHIKNFSCFFDLVLDPSVDVNLIHTHFSDSTWEIFNENLRKKQLHGYTCGACRLLISDDLSQDFIKCAACLTCYHPGCVKNDISKTVQHWFCDSCLK